ncbi:hypothetical protein BVG19_g1832 [[Candida] boidinii]|nr:hypothetical protein BVG19_g1832 [[Candida] boidinii]OWB49362.1 hypothetical protein B5S27_g902 [[Candida] boidinii]
MSTINSSSNSKITKSDKNKLKNKQKVNTNKGLSIKNIEIKKRKIFKPILSNPYINDPIFKGFKFIDKSIQDNLIGLLFANGSILHRVGIINLTKKEKKSIENGSDNKETQTEQEKEEEEDLSYVNYGFNKCNKLLEDQIKLIKQNKINKDDKNYLKYLFICKQDLKFNENNSNLMIKHLPTLCYLSNVKLIQLPKDSNLKISTILNTKNSIEFLLISNGGVDNVLRSFIESTIVDDDAKDNDTTSTTTNYLNDWNYKKVDVKFLLTSQPILKKDKNANNKNK